MIVHLRIAHGFQMVLGGQSHYFGVFIIIVFNATYCHFIIFDGHVSTISRPVHDYLLTAPRGGSTAAPDKFCALSLLTALCGN